MAISAQHFALVDFVHQLMPSGFRVLPYSKHFFALNVVEIQRRWMCVIPASGAASLCFDLIDQIFARPLERLSTQFFVGGVTLAFDAAILLPRPRARKGRRAR